MRLRAIAALGLLLASPVWAYDGQIGLYFDSAVGSTCQMTIPVNCRGRLYVYGLLFGASANGISGAEYKITVGSSAADPDWIFSETFAPGAIILGSGALTPPDNLPRGVNVAWPNCQLGDEARRVLLETVDILNVASSGWALERKLEVVKHDQPSNAFFQCPLFVICDEPVYTKVCVGTNLTQCRNPEPPYPNNATCSTGGVAYLNPDPYRIPCCLSCPPAEADCTIAVERSTWSGVKSLYRD